MVQGEGGAGYVQCSFHQAQSSRPRRLGRSCPSIRADCAGWLRGGSGRFSIKAVSKTLNTEERGSTYRNDCFVHPTLPVNVVLTRDPVTVVHALAAAETHWLLVTLRTTSCPGQVGWVIRVQDVDAVTSVLLRALLGGEDLDGVVDAGYSERWLVGVAYH